MKKNAESSCENVERRKVVKSIVGGVTAVTAYSLLPAHWNSPLVESVFLPAHAATSGSQKNKENIINPFLGVWTEEDGTKWTFKDDGMLEERNMSEPVLNYYPYVVLDSNTAEIWFLADGNGNVDSTATLKGSSVIIDVPNSEKIILVK